MSKLRSFTGLYDLVVLPDLPAPLHSPENALKSLALVALPYNLIPGPSKHS
jgi:hypothetical protein